MRGFLAAAFLSFWNLASHAAVVSYAFTGTEFVTQGGSLFPAISELSSMSGQLSIDDGVIDDVAGDGFGNFLGAARSLDASFDTGFSVHATNGVLIQARSKKAPVVSSWSLEDFSNQVTDVGGGYTLVSVNFNLSDTDTNGQELFNDPEAILTDLPNPTLLEGQKANPVGPAYVGLQFVDGDGAQVLVYGKLDTLTAVPLPAAAWLLLSGLGGLGLLGRRRRAA